jgi:hypothetical protein
MNDVVCRGSWALGTACGACRRCVEGLRTALEESVKLQSLYAELLNGYDGGKRKQFANSDAWLKRLRECGEDV